MLFCLGEGAYESKGDGYQKSYMIFNKPVSLEVFQKALHSLPMGSKCFTLNKLVKSKDMTKEEKEDDRDALRKENYLRVMSYRQAWRVYWHSINQEIKNLFLNLPNFDANIFKEITGVDIFDN
jgi:hypothetical protein